MVARRIDQFINGGRHAVFADGLNETDGKPAQPCDILRPIVIYHLLAFSISSEDLITTGF
jgi:hypothetical protein